ncbi:phage baseplate assembly protein V [Terasakiella sp.]|uniref:phage baseplate assembly protein V n=1 Tax=Terasakiella sp. TaxID=2034861 RepID=UPI003AA91D32
MSWGIQELERRLANLIRTGKIAAVDTDAARVRVRFGDNLSGWLPWLTTRAGADRDWWAPSTGEQVLILSPSGETDQGYVLPSIYQTAHPAPSSDPMKHVKTYSDGTTVEYDRAAHHLVIDCVGDVTIKGATKLNVDFGSDITVKSGTKVTVDAPESVVTGNLTVNGFLTYLSGMAGSSSAGAAAQITGLIEVISGDVTADGISLKNHIHTGDSDGETSPPL